MIGATAIMPSASALHHRTQLSANDASNVCAATAPADSPTSAFATSAPPTTSAIRSRSPPSLKRLPAMRSTSSAPSSPSALLGTANATPTSSELPASR
jgi:hypothetical protein